MLRLTLRSVWEHKRRLVSTVTAIVLGVAFMAGTFVLADTMDKVFDDLFSDVNAEVDVQVQGVALFDANFGGAAREVLDVGLVDRIRSIDGIVAAEPMIQTPGFGSVNRLKTIDGTLIGGSSGPPTLLESWLPDERVRSYELTDGSRGPEADNEVVLNVAAAEEGEIAVGDQVIVITQLGEKTYTVVGTVLFGRAKSAAGATAVQFTLAEAQRIAGLDGTVQRIIAAGDGTDPELLVLRAGGVLPATAEAITGQQAAEQLSDDVTSGLGFFSQILTIFGAIALLVGTFIISNTFAILVAQRTKELALLRAIGATRAQVLSSVLIEAVVIGLIAAIGGLLGGIGLAFLVTKALAASGVDIPTTSLVVSSTTVITSFVIGLGVTMISAVFPAVQATRVPPLAALRDVSLDRSGASKPRAVVGALALLIALFLLSAPWRVDNETDALPNVGLGALLLIVGAIVVGPVLAQPTVRFLGAGLPRLRGITGRLATENAARSPKRTSATASALLIGVSLICFITIFASSATASITSELDRSFRGDLLVQSESGGFGPPGAFPATVVPAIEAVDGVESTLAAGFLQARVTVPSGKDSVTFVQALDPAKTPRFLETKMAEGSFQDLTEGGVVVDRITAEDNDLTIGDTVTMTGTAGQRIDLVVQALSDDRSILGFWSVTNTDLDRLTTEQNLIQVMVAVVPGRDVAEVQAAIVDAISAVPSMEVLDKDQWAGSLTDQVTGVLTFIYGLLALSIIIAMIGIANTLSLSIHERTRELGLLRAVGMTRQQLRSAVRWEAVLIAVLGTTVGLGIGIGISRSVLESLGSLGLNTFSMPIGTLVVVVVLGGSLGVLAALRPARRAAKLNVLDAIATD